MIAQPDGRLRVTAVAPPRAPFLGRAKRERRSRAVAVALLERKHILDALSPERLPDQLTAAAAHSNRPRHDSGARLPKPSVISCDRQRHSAVFTSPRKNEVTHLIERASQSEAKIAPT